MNTWYVSLMQVMETRIFVWDRCDPVHFILKMMEILQNSCEWDGV